MPWFRRPTAPARETEMRAQLDLALQEPGGHTWALVAAAEELASADHALTTMTLERWPPRRWLELDAVRLDEWTSYSGEAAPRGGWSATVDNPKAPTLLLMLASTHRDGYLRERATRALADRSDALASIALAVRSVDHVPEVRSVARQALASRRDPHAAAAVLPVLLAARHREAAKGLVEEYAGALSEDALRALTSSPDRDTRRFAIDRAPLSTDELVEFADSDSDTHARLRAARRAIAADEGTAAELMAVRPATVRALAVSIASEDLVRPQLERLLLDRSSSLRRAAQTRATALAVDVPVIYRERLPTRTAILGLGETGDADDVDEITRLTFASHPPSVRRAAIRSLGRLAPRELLLSLLPPLLESDEPGVVREAGRQLRRLGFTLEGDSLDRALGSAHVWTRQAALGIALGRRGWDTPAAALTLYDDVDEGLREYARAALGSWLARKAPTAGSPTSSQAARLRTALDRHVLPSEVERLVRFHAGL